MYWPVAHSGHDADPLADTYLPAGQSEHDAAPVNAYWPAGQVEHTTDFDDDVY